MILTEEQNKEFRELSRPLIQWINNLEHSYCEAIITCSDCKLVEQVCFHPITDYWKD